MILESFLILTLLMSSVGSSGIKCGPPPSVKEAYHSSDAVFVGKVIELTRLKDERRKISGKSLPPMLPTDKVRLKIETAYRGVEGDEVEVVTIPLNAEWGVYFRLNQTYLVYANKEGEAFRVGGCGRTQLISKAKEDIEILDDLKKFGKSDQNNKTAPDKLKTDDIDIEYGWSLIGFKSLDGEFYVKNNTGKIIRYLANDFDQNKPFWIKKDGRAKKIKPSYIDRVKERELKPGQTAIFSIPVPQNEKSFEAGFIFKIGNSRKEQVIWVKVKKQLKSYGLACNEEIMKAGGVLSKTCITKIPNPN